MFREFFESDEFLKVWHNYGFDRHVMEKAGIQCRGFGADTLHISRLWDSSRKGKGYSLEALTSDRQVTPHSSHCPLNTQPHVSQLKLVDASSKKTSMKELFGRKKARKDGTEGRVTIVAPIEELQREQTDKWIHYSTRDAKATYDLYCKLKEMLDNEEKFMCEMDADVKSSYPNVRTLWDFYVEVWRPFGDLLTDMEEDGILVDTDHLRQAEIEAREDRRAAEENFKKYAKLAAVDGAEHMNPCSDTQIRMLLFAGMQNRKDPSKRVDQNRTIKVCTEE